MYVLLSCNITCLTTSCLGANCSGLWFVGFHGVNITPPPAHSRCQATIVTLLKVELGKMHSAHGYIVF